MASKGDVGVPETSAGRIVGSAPCADPVAITNTSQGPDFQTRPECRVKTAAEVQQADHGLNTAAVDAMGSDGADAAGKLRRRPVGKKRLFVVLSMTIGFLCGLPVWWVTTEVHRATLPHESIEASAARAALSSSSHMSLPRHLCIVIVQPSKLVAYVSDTGGVGQEEAYTKGMLSRQQLDVIGSRLWKIILDKLGEKEERSGKLKEVNKIRLSVGIDSIYGCVKSEVVFSEHNDTHPYWGWREGSRLDLTGDGDAKGTRWPCGLSSAGVWDEWLKSNDTQFDDWLEIFRREHSSVISGEHSSRRRLMGEEGGHYTVIVLLDPRGVDQKKQAKATMKTKGDVNAENVDVAKENVVIQGTGKGGENIVSEEKVISATVGKYRHGWVVLQTGPGSSIAPYLASEDSDKEGKSAGKGLSPSELWAARLLTEVSASLQLIADVGLKLLGSSERKEIGSNLPLAADGTAILSFSLINAEPSDWIYDWNFQAVEREFLRPVLDSLSPVMDLKVESQVLYYGRKAAPSMWDQKRKAHIISSHHLPFFINAEDWILDSSVGAVGRSKLLHFVVYVSAANECPLRLQAPNDELSSTNGFTVPSWGGVVVWNPVSCTRCRQGSICQLSQREMRTIMGVVVAQLRWLFGLRAVPFPAAGEGDQRTKQVEPDSLKKPNHQLGFVPASRAGFSQWEIDMLLRGRAAVDASGAISMLSSLMKLINDMPNMVVPDIIGHEVQVAISSVDSACDAAANGSYGEAAAFARKARANAEDAFFQPTVMALRYLPLEHHLAVYTPLFVPMIIHILVAFLKEVPRWVRLNKEYKLFLALKKHQ